MTYTVDDHHLRYAEAHLPRFERAPEEWAAAKGEIEEKRNAWV
jgi:hypothetical protein